MKKVFLLLIFFCTLSFSDMGGFGDLKWGASREEVTQYMMKTYNLKNYEIYQLKNSIMVSLSNVELFNIDLYNIDFYFNDNGRLSNWWAESYTIKEDKKSLIEKFKKEYTLKEEKEKDGLVILYGYSGTELISISFYPNKITFNIRYMGDRK